MANYVRLNDGAASSARNRQIGSPHHIETCCHYASMRQVHAAIEQCRRGDFECAITLAGAAKRMLPEIEEPRYRELRDIARVNSIGWSTAHPETARKASALIEWSSRSSTPSSRSIARSSSLRRS